jgi:hypothetical protein
VRLMENTRSSGLEVLKGRQMVIVSAVVAFATAIDYQKEARTAPRLKPLQGLSS